jgi:hypothetical protein
MRDVLEGRKIQNTFLQDAQQLHHLNTPIDTIRCLVTSTERYVNIRGYRLQTGVKNTYVEG